MLPTSVHPRTTFVDPWPTLCKPAGGPSSVHIAFPSALPSMLYRNIGASFLIEDIPIPRTPGFPFQLPMPLLTHCGLYKFFPSSLTGFRSCFEHHGYRGPCRSLRNTFDFFRFGWVSPFYTCQCIALWPMETPIQAFPRGLQCY